MLMDDLLDSWNEPKEDKVSEQSEKMSQIKDELEKLNYKRSFKERVRGLANIYGDLKTSDWKYNQEALGDLTDFRKLEFMMDKFPTETVALTGKLANEFHRFAKKNRIYHAAIGQLPKNSSFVITDGVDLNSKKLYNELTNGVEAKLVVYTRFTQVFRFIKRYKMPRYYITWFKNKDMDDMNVFMFSKYQRRLASALDLTDKKGVNEVLKKMYHGHEKMDIVEKGDFDKSTTYSILARAPSESMTMREFKNNFREEKQSNSFDVFLFGKLSADATISETSTDVILGNAAFGK